MMGEAPFMRGVAAGRSACAARNDWRRGARSAPPTRLRVLLNDLAPSIEKRLDGRVMLVRRVADSLRLRAKRKRLVGCQFERLIQNRFAQRQRRAPAAAKLSRPRNGR